MGVVLEGAHVIVMCISSIRRQVSWLSNGYLVLRITHIYIPRTLPNPLLENFGNVYFGEDEYFVESDTPEREGIICEN